MQPTVFSDVTRDMTIAQEEIFGPVLSIIPYDTEEEAIDIANDTPYGLAGGVWCGDPERAERVARQMRTGQVDVNGGAFNPIAPSAATSSRASAASAARSASRSSSRSSRCSAKEARIGPIGREFGPGTRHPPRPVWA